MGPGKHFVEFGYEVNSDLSAKRNRKFYEIPHDFEYRVSIKLYEFLFRFTATLMTFQLAQGIFFRTTDQ